MKNVLITAGGTASAYYFCKLIKDFFGQSVRLYLTDINDSRLIPASLLADVYFKVPGVAEEAYRETMLQIVREKSINAIVPLIDMDLLQFPKDDQELASMGCMSTATSRDVSACLSDKVELNMFAARLGVSVPLQYQRSEVDAKLEYFVKPRLGFGSRGARRMSGCEILELPLESDLVIQELCNAPEVTVEVFCHNGVVETLCRQRLEVKAGVCTKAKVYRDPQLHGIIERIAQAVQLPVASCFQFMRSNDGDWCLTDANLRIGAGSALCAAVGWNLPLAALEVWLGDPLKATSHLMFKSNERYVARVFEEIVTV